MIAGTAAAEELSGSAQINTEDLTARLSFGGSGEWVCSAESSMEEIPFLGRAASRSGAEAVAKAECARNDERHNGFFCKVQDCERSNSSDGRLKIRIEDGSLRIGYSSAVNFECVAEDSFQNIPVVVQAPTLVEAKALAKRAAIEGGAKPFFVRVTDCERVARRNGHDSGLRIDEAGGILRNIFGGSHR